MSSKNTESGERDIASASTSTREPTTNCKAEAAQLRQARLRLAAQSVRLSAHSRFNLLHKRSGARNRGVRELAIGYVVYDLTKVGDKLKLRTPLPDLRSANPESRTSNLQSQITNLEPLKRDLEGQPFEPCLKNETFSAIKLVEGPCTPATLNKLYICICRYSCVHNGSLERAICPK